MVLGFVVNGLGALLCLATYGYMEKVTNIEGSGIFVSLVLAYYLVSERGPWQRIIAPILLFAQVYIRRPFEDIIPPTLQVPVWLNENNQGCYTLFVLLVLQLFLSPAPYLDGSYEGTDVQVQLLPYEREIRRVMWRYDRDQLHTVDTMLRENRGYEDVLLKKLMEKYGVDDQALLEITSSPTPVKVSKQPSEDASTFDWSLNSRLFQEEIERVVAARDETLLKHLPGMFRDYYGREEQLLKAIYSEFKMTYIAPPHMRKYGNSVAPVVHNPNSMSSPFTSRSQTMADIALDDARRSIQKNLEERMRRAS
jgi:hypothetical protein